MEIYGRDGTLNISSKGSPNTNTVRIQGVKEGNTLEDLEVPERYTFVLEGMPQGEPVQGIPSSKRDSSAILVKSLRGVVLDKGKKVYWPLGRNGGPIGAGGGQEPVR